VRQQTAGYSQSGGNTRGKPGILPDERRSGLRGRPGELRRFSGDFPAGFTKCQFHFLPPFSLISAGETQASPIDYRNPVAN
jgi:hypothetical protein